MSKKLYRVTRKGMTYSASGPIYGVSYVVAENTYEAYKRVREYLDENDLGFRKERELDKVELIAEATKYPECETILYA